jgi:hypothetical protein
MAEREDSIKVRTLFPWFIILVLVLAFIFVSLKHRGGEGGSAYETAIREDEIVSAMRLSLMKAAEAEKSAVLAVTDEESREFADKARLASAEVEKDRKELAPLIEQDNSTPETSRIAEFDKCWRKFRKVDQLLLDLAVQNTNIRASDLAFTNGAEALRKLEAGLTRLIDLDSSEGGNSQIVRLSYQALVAGIKIHDQYAAHIEAETDEEMDWVEKDIKANEEILNNSLSALARLAKGKESDTVKDAIAADHELEKVTKEIIALSRKNTNIKSIELSLGKKRLVTAQCEDVLGAIQEFIRSKGTRATR